MRKNKNSRKLSIQQSGSLVYNHFDWKNKITYFDVIL